MKINWKRVRPTSLNQAIEFCLAHAREKKNLSVDRVADLMGLTSKWTLYKWLESGRMPAILIPTFEHACGIDFVTQYLAYSRHKLLIDIPTGKYIDECDVNDIQISFSESIKMLIEFYKGKSSRDETVAAIDHVIGEIAWHRENLQKTDHPELSLFEGSDNE